MGLSVRKRAFQTNLIPWSSIIDVDVKVFLHYLQDFGKLLILQMSSETLVRIARHSDDEFSGFEMLHESALDHVILSRQSAERLYILGIQL